MKTTLRILCRLSCFLIAVIVFGCKKVGVIDGQDESLHTINLQLKGFSTEKKPLNQAITPASPLASTSGSQQDYEGYLFFWSFNQETLVPDIRVPSADPIDITYNSGLFPNNFVNSTYSHSTYPAGKALSITGANELTIEIPMTYVQELTTLGFDIGSTNTGPKDFEIYYSWDGITYSLLQAVNQFNSSTANAKNSFTYDLQNLETLGSRLWVRLILKAGDRMGGSDYNPNSGAFRIDNIHLKGAYQLTASADIAKLYYFIYHRDRTEIFATGEVEEDEWDGFDIALPSGTYDVFLITNQSNMELIFPSSKEQWNTLYASNYFANAQAEIFGVVDEIQVSKNETFSFTLERMFSQIKFEFTDNDLSIVDKIVVTPLHDPYFYNPSGQVSSNPVLDQTEIVFNENINNNKHVTFNQFMGLLSNQQPISYQLDVYAEDAIIRTLTVNSSLSNNMQMVFRGELLSGLAFAHGFTVTKNETWGDSVEVTF